MAYEATSARPGPAARARAAGREAIEQARGSEALRAALAAFAWSRALVFAVAVYAALAAGGGGLGARNEAKFDFPALTQPLGGAGDVALSPLARWDAVWFLTIANDGYEGEGSPRQAFFPLYPLLSRGVGELGGGGPGAVLIASYLVALAAFLAALVLLWKLAALELGRRAAGPVLLLLCAFPASLFFGAPYSESLFLLCSVGAFYAARTGNWMWAGIAAGAAAATRNAGILLALPLAILLWEEKRGSGARPAGARAALLARRSKDWLWLLLCPAGLGAYALFLGLAHGDPLAFSNVQEFWNRDFAGPLGGAWQGLTAAIDGARQLGSGSRETIYFTEAAGDPFRIGAQNLMLFGFLVFALVAAVGVLKRLPFAYGAYVVAALMLPLSFPVGPQPLMSLPRFIAVLFPVFMWMAIEAEERRMTAKLAAASAIGLGLFTAEFASWHFIA